MTTEAQTIRINPLSRTRMNVVVKAIEGSTLITHRLSIDTVRNKITNRESGKKSEKKLRNFDEEYESCFYKTEEGDYGIPAGAFFKSMLDACVSVDIPKTHIKRSVRITADIIPLKYKKLNRRVDVTRRAGITKAPDERHRPEFVDWSCKIPIDFDANQISPEQIVNLLNVAGFTTGVGDWRPEKNGSHGMFEVEVKK